MLSGLAGACKDMQRKDVHVCSHIFGCICCTHICFLNLCIMYLSVCLYECVLGNGGGI